MALSSFRKIESQAVKGASSSLKVSLPYEMATYLLNQKRSELCKLETTYDMTIHISGVPDMAWDAITIEANARKPVKETLEERAERLPRKKGEQGEFEAEAEEGGNEEEGIAPEEQAGEIAAATEEGSAMSKKKPHRRRRSRHRRPSAVLGEASETPPEAMVETTTLPQALEEAVPEAEKAADQETVADVPLPEPSPARRRPFSWRRKKKTAPEMPSPDVGSERKEPDNI